MSFEPREYLRHILVEVEFLMRASAGLDREQFMRDETKRRAFVRSLEVIGEAARKLPEPFRRLHPQFEWKAMAGMRDRLIHGYFGIDYDLVWDVVQDKVPLLKQEVEALLNSKPGGPLV